MPLAALAAAWLAVHRPYVDPNLMDVQMSTQLPPLRASSPPVRWPVKVQMSSHGPSVRASKTSRPLIVSPSVAKANQMALGEDLKAATDAGAEWLHFSVQVGRLQP